MGKVWVLDTETKGTGANMVPLEDARAKRSPEAAKGDVPPKPRPRAPAEPAPKRPPRFRVVDVMTRQTLLEGGDGRATVDLLKDVRSVVDVRISAWNDEAGAWRLLSL